MDSTSKLIETLEKIGKSPEDFLRFEQEHPVSAEFDSLEKYLNTYLAEHQELTLSQIYLDSNISRSYGDQIFNGRRKHPNKYKLIPICLAMGMDRKETNRALRLAGQAELDPRNRKDQALIICANEHIGKLMEINQLLEAFQIKPISN